MITVVAEWIASLTGILGAFLLATHSRASRWGWVAFFIANVAGIIFSLCIQRYGILLQQVVFMGTSLLGLYKANFFRSWTRLFR